MENIQELCFDQVNFFKEIHTDFLKEARDKLINKFISMDLEIKNGIERLNKGWYVKDIRTRKQKTIYGPICFPRTRYWNKYTKEYKYLVDDQINIKKYKRLIPSLELEILNRVGNGNRYCDIIDSLRDANISEQTISNVIKRFNISKEALLELECNKIDVSDKPYIYLETDDTFPTLKVDKKKQEYRVRLLTAHTGSKKGLHKRNYLENKRVDYLIVKNGEVIKTTEYAQRIEHLLNNWFNNIEDKQLILLGDAASWIPNLAREMNAKYVLDKFHLLKLLRNIFPICGRKNEKVDKYRYFFYSLRKQILMGNSFELIMEKCNEIYLWLENEGWIDKLDEFKSFISFIKRNKVGIQNYYKEFDSSSHTEGMISWFIKSILGYGKKIYGYLTFNKLLLIKKLKTNGYNFNSLLEYDLETIQIDNLEYDFKYVDQYKSIGYLNRDKKTNKITKSGSYLHSNSPGFKHNNY